MGTIEKLKGSNRRVVVVLRKKLFKNDGSCDISALWKQNHSLWEVSGNYFPRQGSPTTTYRVHFLTISIVQREGFWTRAWDPHFIPCVRKRENQGLLYYNIWDLQLSGNEDPIKTRPSSKSAKCVWGKWVQVLRAREDLWGFAASKSPTSEPSMSEVPMDQKPAQPEVQCQREPSGPTKGSIFVVSPVHTPLGGFYFHTPGQKRTKEIHSVRILADKCQANIDSCFYSGW